MWQITQDYIQVVGSRFVEEKEILLTYITIGSKIDWWARMDGWVYLCLQLHKTKITFSLFYTAHDFKIHPNSRLHLRSKLMRLNTPTLFHKKIFKWNMYIGTPSYYNRRRCYSITLGYEGKSKSTKPNLHNVHNLIGYPQTPCTRVLAFHSGISNYRALCGKVD